MQPAFSRCGIGGARAYCRRRVIPLLRRRSDGGGSHCNGTRMNASLLRRLVGWPVIGRSITGTRTPLRVMKPLTRPSPLVFMRRPAPVWCG